jgi:hypothetical protein
MRHYKLTFFIIVICLLTFLIINSFKYEEFKGGSGEGYKLGFALSTESIISIVILLISIPAYFAVKRLINPMIKS